MLKVTGVERYKIPLLFKKDHLVISADTISSPQEFFILSYAAAGQKIENDRYQRKANCPRKVKSTLGIELMKDNM